MKQRSDTVVITAVPSQRNNAIILIPVLAILFGVLLSGCDLLSGFAGSGGTDNSDTGAFTAFQIASLDEINFLRTNPSLYADTRLRDDYTDGTDNGAYEDLLDRSQVDTLALDVQLCTAATDYAQYMAQNDVFGHNERLTPGERCLEAGYEYWSGENIAAGSHSYYDATVSADDAAEAFVRMLIIDEGVPSLGHRENLLSSTHTELGIGFFRDTSSTYDNYYVQDFGSQ